MERIEYHMPQPAPQLAVRRLVPDNAAQIAALYRAAGRDGAWCAQENTVRALFDMGAVWWGGFVNGDLALCAACTASTADTPQAAALRGALAQGSGNPAPEPERFLLPPAASRQGEMLAGPLLLLLTEQLFLFAATAPQPEKVESPLQDTQETAAHWSASSWLRETGPATAVPRQWEAEPAPAVRWPREAETVPIAPRQRDAKPASALLAALPVKAPAPLLAAYLAAGFAAVCMRPLVSLRPHYLLRRRSALGQAAETDVPSPQEETGAVRSVYLPLADTLAVSRLLEQGFYATALCRSSADERMLIQLER